MKYIIFGEHIISVKNTYFEYNAKTFQLKEVSGEYVLRHHDGYLNVIAENGICKTVLYSADRIIRQAWLNNISCCEPILYLVLDGDNLLIYHNGKLYHDANFNEVCIPVIENNEFRIVNTMFNRRRHLFYIGDITLSAFKRGILLDIVSLEERPPIRMLQSISLD